MEESLSWDRFRHVFDLVQSGNRSFRENCLERFEEVAKLLSIAFSCNLSFLRYWVEKVSLLRHWYCWSTIMEPNGLLCKESRQCFPLMLERCKLWRDYFLFSLVKVSLHLFPTLEVNVVDHERVLGCQSL